jgi:FkbM family methyltransferase
MDSSSYRLHNESRVLNTDPLTIESGPQQWSYAVDFDVQRDEASAVEVIVDLDVTVGQVGIGLLNDDESAFHIERQLAADDGRTAIPLRLSPEQTGRRLVIRNTGDGGAAAFVVHGIDVRSVAPQDLTPIPSIEISSDLFRPFRLFSGTVPAGFWVNWIGVLTRAHVWPFAPDVQALYGRDRHEDAKYPFQDEHVLDWIPLLEAVLSSGPLFRMAALGAGWGRWLTAGAFAAAQTQRTAQLTGVEAEPEHFAWMEEHMRDNNIDPRCVRMLNAAASPSPEPCWFPVASPAWYGQSIVAASRADEQGAGEERVVDGVRLRRVASVTIEDLLPDDATVDYLHMDIQGTEYDFLARDPERLTRCVRVVNIGTHSEIIERRLRTLFHSLGWQCEYDIALGSTAELRVDGNVVGQVPFGDGVQVWTNPVLSDPASHWFARR